jgi:hypothetical protein
MSLLLCAGPLLPAALGANAEAFLASQDPPVIPRAIAKRPPKRPERFVRTELFFGTAAREGTISEEQFLAFLDE